MYKLENCFSCFCEGKKYANQLTFARVDGVINAKINYNMDNNKFENFTKLINQNIKINNPEPIFPRILND